MPKKEVSALTLAENKGLLMDTASGHACVIAVDVERKMLTSWTHYFCGPAK